jgi:hypothetical protein
MRISNQALLAAMVLSLCSGATIAAEAVNPDTLPRVDCSSLRYSEDFLQKYPTPPRPAWKHASTRARHT